MVQNFVKAYKAKYGNEPGAMAALGYDGILVIADALKRAGSMDHKAINMAITSTKNVKGVSGLITIDSQRNAKKSAVVLATNATGFSFKEVVNP